MKKTYYTISYIVLSLTALVMASGAPLALVVVVPAADR